MRTRRRLGEALGPDDAVGEIMGPDDAGGACSPGRANALIAGCEGIGPSTCSRFAALRGTPPFSEIFSIPSLMSAAIFLNAPLNLLGASTSIFPFASSSVCAANVRSGFVCSRKENRRPRIKAPTTPPITP